VYELNAPMSSGYVFIDANNPGPVFVCVIIHLTRSFINISLTSTDLFIENFLVSVSTFEVGIGSQETPLSSDS